MNGALCNATILRVDAPGAPNAFGEETFVEGSSIDVRCTVDASLYNARRELGATLKDATSGFYVRRSSGLTLVEKCRLLVKVDGEAAATLWELVYVKPRVKGVLSHTEAYGKEVA